MNYPNRLCAAPKALSQPDLHEVLGQAVPARMVAPGERIAIRVPPAQTCLVAPDTSLAKRVPATAGESGFDVFGNELTASGQEAHLDAAAHVHLEEDVYRSEVYGYVCLLGEELSVLPPVWISPDRMEAHFIHFPEAKATTPPTEPLQRDWIRSALEAAGVHRGVLDDAVERLCSEPVAPRQRNSVLLARGTPPMRGRDTHIEFAIDYEKKAGRIRPDGSIDFRERNTVVAVVADDLLGELAPATTGEPGFDVTGEALPAEDGEEREFRAGDNVRQVHEEGVSRFYAETDGAVHLDADVVRVSQVVSISGDVDYDSGDIEVGGDVQITGHVRSGFSVRARGSVTVGGVIEAGASVNARGDVVASKGIVGDTTRVVALGSVETRYVQNASVLAGGDITVGSYVFNGSLRAGGRIAVHSAGGDRGGSIVGGEVLATGGIRAPRIGSPETDRTVVGIGAPPEVTFRQARLRETIDRCDREVERICLVVGLEAPDPGDEDHAATAAARVRRPEARAAADRLRALGRERRNSVAEQHQLDERVAATLREQQIEVEDTAYADVLLRFGSRNSALAEDVGAAVFYLGKDGIRWRPLDE